MAARNKAIRTNYIKSKFDNNKRMQQIDTKEIQE